MLLEGSAAREARKMGEAAARTKRCARMVRPGDFAGIKVTSRRSRIGDSSKRRSVFAFAEGSVADGDEDDAIGAA